MVRILRGVEKPHTILKHRDRRKSREAGVNRFWPFLSICLFQYRNVAPPHFLFNFFTTNL